MRELPYELCDVFTDRPLAGKTNLSESAFVIRATSAMADAGIRIFTPTMELPFAGHPMLGTAFVLAACRQLETVNLETARGIVSVRISCEADQTGFKWMNQPLPRIAPY